MQFSTLNEPCWTDISVTSEAESIHSITRDRLICLGWLRHRRRTMFMDMRYITVVDETVRYAPPGKRPVWYAWPRLARVLKTAERM